MTPQEETLMEFPCSFGLKAMGLATDDFDALVFSLVSQHVKNLSEGAVTTKPSGGGKYISVTITFEATSRKQLDEIYHTVTAHERVLMAL